MMVSEYTLILVAILINAIAGSRVVGGCGIIQGPSGRDGRDGLPGPPGTCCLSFADSRDLKKDIEGDLSDIIEAAIRDLTDEKMGSIVQPCKIVLIFKTLLLPSHVVRSTSAIVRLPVDYTG